DYYRTRSTDPRPSEDASEDPFETCESHIGWRSCDCTDHACGVRSYTVHPHGTEYCRGGVRTWREELHTVRFATSTHVGREVREQTEDIGSGYQGIDRCAVA